MATLKFTSIPPKTLLQSIVSTATTFKVSNIVGWDGSTSLTAADFGTQAFGVFTNADRSRVEFFEWDPSTIADTSITLTNRGLPFDGTGTPITALKLDWTANDTTVLLGSDVSQVFQYLVDYIDGIAVSGAPDASLTAKGLVESATAAEINADTLAGTTGADLSARPDQLALSKYGQQLPTAGEKAALTASQGVPTTDNPILTEDDTSASTFDQSQVTQDGSSVFGTASTTGLRNSIAQSFIPGKTKMRGVSLYKIANTGTFTGTITVSLRADDSGDPDAAVLATVTITNAEWLDKAVGAFEAIFSTEYASLVAGDIYHIVLETSTADSSNHPNVGINTVGGYASGSVKYNNATDGWVAIATIDLYFTTLEGNANQEVKTNAAGNIPAEFLDPSELPQVAFTQDLTIYGSQQTGNVDDNFAMTSNADGSVIFFGIGATSSFTIYRMERDANSGVFIYTHQDAPSLAERVKVSLTVVGDYVYMTTNNGTNIVVSRFLAADLTGEQVMSVPTVACDDTGSLSWTDGVFFYVASQTASTVSNKWSISGTTMSAVDTGVIANLLSATSQSMFDGTNAYIAKSTASVTTIYKLIDGDGSSKTTATMNINHEISNIYAGTILIPIDDSRFYVGFTYGSYNKSNADAVQAQVMKLIPVTKT